MLSACILALLVLTLFPNKTTTILDVNGSWTETETAAPPAVRGHKCHRNTKTLSILVSLQVTGANIVIK